MRRGLIIFIVFLLLVFYCMATPVVTWNAFYLDNGNEFYADFVLGTTILPDPYVLIWFDLTSDYFGATIRPSGSLAGLAYRIVEMDEGNLVDANGIWTKDAFASNFAETNRQSTAILFTDEPLYFGIQLGSIDEDGYGFIQYGWAKLLWDGEYLTLESSALETTGLGIYCGEFRAVPEPGTVGLLLAGGAGLLGMRRRRCNENHKAKS